MHRNMVVFSRPYTAPINCTWYDSLFKQLLVKCSIQVRTEALQHVYVIQNTPSMLASYTAGQVRLNEGRSVINRGSANCSHTHNIIPLFVPDEFYIIPKAKTESADPVEPLWPPNGWQNVCSLVVYQLLIDWLYDEWNSPNGLNPLPNSWT